MKEQINNIISNVAVDTLEKLAFIFSFPEDERDTTGHSSVTAAAISFTGPFTGNLVITFSVSALPELAANMLGLDDEDEVSLDQQYDALKETINIICGNILPAVFGKQSIFNIGSPEIITEAEAIKEAVKNDDETRAESIVRLALDEGECDLFLFVDNVKSA
ncbi:MAG: chemotaxis protein CheX [Thermodesulfobacteriota bacterium]|nr:chemotaxis protein CheX [Thermodesulfobacteriota bacterium]